MYLLTKKYIEIFHILKWNKKFSEIKKNFINELYFYRTDNSAIYSVRNIHKNMYILYKR